MRLVDLKDNEEGIIIKILGHGAFRKRITEMGFVKGKKVTVIKNAPLQDPVEYKILDYNILLRRSEAELIEVVAPSDFVANNFQRKICAYSKDCENDCHITEDITQTTIPEDLLKNSAKEKSRIINIALVGNPNCGKTTLYNIATGSHEKVGNYGGVTVEARETTIKKQSYTFKIVDLPGTYSITEYTPEELFVRNHINESRPDIVVNVVDAANLERNLFLTTQLIDMNIKVVIALNMFDELQKTGAKLDYETLGKMLGIPIIPTVARNGKGIEELFAKLIEVYEDNEPTVRHIHINYGKEVEKSIDSIKVLIKENPDISAKYAARNLAIKLLESDKTTLNLLKDSPNFPQIKQQTVSEISAIENEFKEKAETVITDAKYGFISGALSETFQAGYEDNFKKTAQIDNILTSKLLGFPIFIFFMWLMFQATFTLGSYPQEWIGIGIGALSNFVNDTMEYGILRNLLANGIIGGVGGVIVFLPNILILFFFISFMEDSGYMARAAFIMDKLMHKIGLHGKSFIPLVMGFGCTVPAVMATRTLENRKDRILTMLMLPFMSCSAKLPVYVLLISAFFPTNQGLVLVSIYLIGILISILTALFLKKYLFKEKDVPFVMELPPYRIPTFKNTTSNMWFKALQYLKKMGGVILIASILIWALGYFPRDVEFSRNFAQEIELINANSFLTVETKLQKINELEMEMQTERQEKSYIGQMGKFIEPIISPLGFDWKIGVSIIAGLAAKEIIVSTMGVLYSSPVIESESRQSIDLNNSKSHFNTDNAIPTARNDGEVLGLATNLQSQKHQNGEKIFSPLVAYTLMIFVLLYFPCVATIAAIRKEANTKWAIFAALYTTTVAWIAAFLVFQIGGLF